MKKAIILLSGGLDSATCLAIAKSQGFECFALRFDYGQKHAAELLAAENIAKYFSADLKTISIDNVGGSALTDKKMDVPDYMESNNIPATYVPARNTIFLSFALGYAEVIKAESIFIGVNAVDYSGYPDCRPEYIAAFQTLANLATKTTIEGNHIKIEAPLLYLNKAEIIQLGSQLGVDYSMTVSCYRANKKGEACGKCDSCIYRKKGFRDAKLVDNTKYTK